MTEKRKTSKAEIGRTLTDADIEAKVDEAERGYDLETLRTQHGRPMSGPTPSEVVSVRLDPDLRPTVEARAEADHTTTREVTRGPPR
jgi:hypothetical protein